MNKLSTQQTNIMYKYHNKNKDNAEISKTCRNDNINSLISMASDMRPTDSGIRSY